MTSKAITTFNQWQLRPLVWNGKSTVLQRDLLMRLATLGSASGSTSICPRLWSGETLSAYWPVCKFDLILPALFPNLLFFLVAFNVLTTITAYHLPLYQCVAIAFRIIVLSIRFIIPSVSQCYLAHLLVKYLVNRIAYDEYSVVSCSTLLETSEALQFLRALFLTIFVVASMDEFWKTLCSMYPV